MTGQSVEQILFGVIAGQPLSDGDALYLLKRASLRALGRAADVVRRQKHPGDIVTYIVDRNINYTDICDSGCLFCAFYRAPGDTGGYILSSEELEEKVRQTQDLGGEQILLQGGLHPDHDITWYEKMVSGLKERTGVHIHGFSGPEIVHIAKLSNISIQETIARLQKAGLDSIPGGGAEILVDRVRQKISPNKCSADEWIEVMRQAHHLGMRTTATMMFGHIETLEERIESLRRIRDLQEETGGFTAFIPWPFQPDNTALASLPPTGGHAYLAMLSLSRLYLHNIDNIQASWVTQGAKIAGLSLLFGANDMGSTMQEENVVAAAGVRFRLSEDDVRKIIAESGFTPRRRRMDYSLIEPEKETNT